MLKAVLFDLDGVIIDTERVGHRVAFNEAFVGCGYPKVNWDEDLYHQLLQVGGGKERIKYYFNNFYNDTAPPPKDMDAFVSEMHRVKTDIFVKRLPHLPLRPGVLRFMSALKSMGVTMGICTTSNEKVAETVANVILSDIPFEVILAGDMVKTKKPDPEIYNTALKRLNVLPQEVVVIEDSEIGVQAAKAANCTVIATYNGYTEDEDLSPADFIVSCLGDSYREKTFVKKESFPILLEGVVCPSLIAKGML